MSNRSTLVRVGGTAIMALLVGVSSIITTPDLAFAKTKKTKERDKTPLPDILICTYHKHDAPVMVAMSAGNKKLDNTRKFQPASSTGDPLNPFTCPPAV